MEGAPSSKIALPTRPRLPLLCPRSSSPATVKKAAQLQVAASNVREDVTSEHAAVLRDCTLAAPARLTRRATAQLSAESFGSSHRQRRQQQRPRWSAHVARTGEREKSLPNPPSGGPGIRRRSKFCGIHQGCSHVKNCDTNHTTT
jgi:hypothetical protein